MGTDSLIYILYLLHYCIVGHLMNCPSSDRMSIVDLQSLLREIHLKKHFRFQILMEFLIQIKTTQCLMDHMSSVLIMMTHHFPIKRWILLNKQGAGSQFHLGTLPATIALMAQSHIT
jgi:hypothetical protein